MKIVPNKRLALYGQSTTSVRAYPQPCKLKSCVKIEKKSHHPSPRLINNKIQFSLGSRKTLSASQSRNLCRQDYHANDPTVYFSPISQRRRSRPWISSRNSHCFRQNKPGRRSIKRRRPHARTLAAVHSPNRCETNSTTGIQNDNNKASICTWASEIQTGDAAEILCHHTFYKEPDKRLNSSVHHAVDSSEQQFKNRHAWELDAVTVPSSVYAIILHWRKRSAAGLCQGRRRSVLTDQSKHDAMYWRLLDGMTETPSVSMHW